MAKNTQRPMTTEEVYAYIESQMQWTELEKLGVKQLYKSYVSLASRPKYSFANDLANVLKEDLARYGIIV